MSGFQEDHQVTTKTRKKVTPPKRFRVILLNDDYTSMEFVVYILESVFHKSAQEAFSLMMAIHQTGSGVAGVFSYEVAEMKTALVMEIARKNEYPLQCVMEED